MSFRRALFPWQRAAVCSDSVGRPGGTHNDVLSDKKNDESGEDDEEGQQTLETPMLGKPAREGPNYHHQQHQQQPQNHPQQQPYLHHDRPPPQARAPGAGPRRMTLRGDEWGALEPNPVGDTEEKSFYTKERAWSSGAQQPWCWFNWGKMFVDPDGRAAYYWMNCVAKATQFHTENKDDKISRMTTLSLRVCYVYATQRRRALVTVAVIYNFIVIILRVAFEELTDPNMASSVFRFLDIVADVIFLADLAVQSRTAYLEDGYLVRDLRQTMRHYRSQPRFVLDVLSITPVTSILAAAAFFVPVPTPVAHDIDWPAFRLPRLLKYPSMNRFFEKTDSRTNNPNLLRAFKLSLHLWLVIHWIGCFYFLLSKYEGLGSNDWVYPRGNGSDSFMRKYVVCMFWSTMTLTTIGERPSPVTDIEYIFTGTTFLIGVFVFAAVVGNVGDVISNMNAARHNFQARMDQIKFYLNDRRVPEHLQDRVKRWAEYTWTRTKAIDEHSVLQLLPSRLRTEIAIHVHLDTLKKVRIFEQCEEGLLRELVLKLRSSIYSPGEYICRIGEVGREMYIIDHGRVEILFPDSVTGRPKRVAVMTPGNYFGEISLLKLDDGQNKRTADVRSIGFSELLCLSRRDLMAALMEYPEAKKILEQHARQRMLQTKVTPPADSADSPRAPSDKSSVGSGRRSVKAVFTEVMRQEGFTRLLSSRANEELTEMKQVLRELKQTTNQLADAKTVKKLMEQCVLLETMLRQKDQELQEVCAQVLCLNAALCNKQESSSASSDASNTYLCQPSPTTTGKVDKCVGTDATSPTPSLKYLQSWLDEFYIREGQGDCCTIDVHKLSDSYVVTQHASAETGVCAQTQAPKGRTRKSRSPQQLRTSPSPPGQCVDESLVIGDKDIGQLPPEGAQHTPVMGSICVGGGDSSPPLRTLLPTLHENQFPLGDRTNIEKNWLMSDQNMSEAQDSTCTSKLYAHTADHQATEQNFHSGDPCTPAEDTSQAEGSTSSSRCTCTTDDNSSQGTSSSSNRTGRKPPKPAKRRVTGDCGVSPNTASPDGRPAQCLVSGERTQSPTRPALDFDFPPRTPNRNRHYADLNTAADFVSQPQPGGGEQSLKYLQTDTGGAADTNKQDVYTLKETSDNTQGNVSGEDEPSASRMHEVSGEGETVSGFTRNNMLVDNPSSNGRCVHLAPAAAVGTSGSELYREVHPQAARSPACGAEVTDGDASPWEGCETSSKDGEPCVISEPSSWQAKDESLAVSASSGTQERTLDTEVQSTEEVIPGDRKNFLVYSHEDAEIERCSPLRIGESVNIVQETEAVVPEARQAISASSRAVPCLASVTESHLSSGFQSEADFMCQVEVSTFSPHTAPFDGHTTDESTTERSVLSQDVNGESSVCDQKSSYKASDFTERDSSSLPGIEAARFTEHCEEGIRLRLASLSLDDTAHSEGCDELGPQPALRWDSDTHEGSSVYPADSSQTTQRCSDAQASTISSVASSSASHNAPEHSQDGNSKCVREDNVSTCVGREVSIEKDDVSAVHAFSSQDSQQMSETPARGTSSGSRYDVTTRLSPTGGMSAPGVTIVHGSIDRSDPALSGPSVQDSQTMSECSHAQEVKDLPEGEGKAVRGRATSAEESTPEVRAGRSDTPTPRRVTCQKLDDSQLKLLLNKRRQISEESRVSPPKDSDISTQNQSRRTDNRMGFFGTSIACFAHDVAVRSSDFSHSPRDTIRADPAGTSRSFKSLPQTVAASDPGERHPSSLLFTRKNNRGSPVQEQAALPSSTGTVDTNSPKVSVDLLSETHKDAADCKVADPVGMGSLYTSCVASQDSKLSLTVKRYLPPDKLQLNRNTATKSLWQEPIPDASRDMSTVQQISQREGVDGSPCHALSSPMQDTLSARGAHIQERSAPVGSEEVPPQRASAPLYTSLSRHTQAHRDKYDGPVSGNTGARAFNIGICSNECSLSPSAAQTLTQSTHADNPTTQSFDVRNKHRDEIQSNDTVMMENTRQGLPERNGTTFVNNRSEHEQVVMEKTDEPDGRNTKTFVQKDITVKASVDKKSAVDDENGKTDKASGKNTSPKKSPPLRHKFLRRRSLTQRPVLADPSSSESSMKEGQQAAQSSESTQSYRHSEPASNSGSRCECPSDVSVTLVKNLVWETGSDQTQTTPTSPSNPSAQRTLGTETDTAQRHETRVPCPDLYKQSDGPETAATPACSSGSNASSTIDDLYRECSQFTSNTNIACTVGPSDRRVLLNSIQTPSSSTRLGSPTDQYSSTDGRCGDHEDSGTNRGRRDDSFQSEKGAAECKMATRTNVNLSNNSRSPTPDHVSKASDETHGHVCPNLNRMKAPDAVDEHVMGNTISESLTCQPLSSSTREDRRRKSLDGCAVDSNDDADLTVLKPQPRQSAGNDVSPRDLEQCFTQDIFVDSTSKEGTERQSLTRRHWSSRPEEDTKRLSLNKTVSGNTEVADPRHFSGEHTADEQPQCLSPARFSEEDSAVRKPADCCARDIVVETIQIQTQCIVDSSTMDELCRRNLDKRPNSVMSSAEHKQSADMCGAGSEDQLSDLDNAGISTEHVLHRQPDIPDSSDRGAKAREFAARGKSTGNSLDIMLCDFDVEDVDEALWDMSDCLEHSDLSSDIDDLSDSAGH